MRLRLAGLVVLALLATACPGAPSSVTSGRPDGGPSPTGPVAGAVKIPEVEPGGAATAASAIRALCVAPATPSTTSTPSTATETPTAIQEVESQVEQVRGLNYLHPVGVEAISDAEMDRRLTQSFDDSYPKDLYDRRTVAWRTIGVVPQNTDLRAVLRSFLTGQVAGFYDPETGELVYLGSGDLGLIERLELAHELTHALDDQHFDLSRLDDLSAHCQDERFEGGLGVVEGSAQYFSAQTLIAFPTMDLRDVLSALGQAFGTGSAPAGVPPFVEEQEIWPYTAGMAFVTSRTVGPGTAGVNQALTDLPVSTEQIMHPDHYPSDLPVKVDIPNLAPALGAAWGDLDAMQVGEEWLHAMLGLRLDPSTTEEAAAGWGGGVYRAWTDGEHVAVVLATAWDTPQDATEFAGAARDWIGDAIGSVAGGRAGGVTLTFASDRGTLDRLNAARQDAGR
jgi:hypothetical protein